MVYTIGRHDGSTILWWPVWKVLQGSKSLQQIGFERYLWRRSQLLNLQQPLEKWSNALICVRNQHRIWIPVNVSKSKRSTTYPALDNDPAATKLLVWRNCEKQLAKAVNVESFPVKTSHRTQMLASWIEIVFNLGGEYVEVNFHRNKHFFFVFDATVAENTLACALPWPIGAQP